jgi:glucokinase
MHFSCRLTITLSKYTQGILAKKGYLELSCASFGDELRAGLFRDTPRVSPVDRSYLFHVFLAKDGSHGSFRTAARYPAVLLTSPRAEERMSKAAVHHNLVIGVDIGGTKVAAGIVDRATGEISGQTRTPMKARGSASEGLAAVVSAIDFVLKNRDTQPSGIEGIGICSPGPLDPQSGVVINPPNLPCWRDFPLSSEVSRAYGLPVKVDNDANAAALAETLWGAGRGHRSVFYATIGTGIGTGIVMDGHIYHGRTGAAGEGGHMTIDFDGVPCVCGKRGCIETLASGPAIARAALAQLAANPKQRSAILDLAGGCIHAVTCEMVGQAYAEGDQVARKVLEGTVEFLSVWLGNIVDLLEPEVIIIGGGVATMLDPFFGQIRERLPDCCLSPRCREIPLVRAFYGPEAGIAGGAALCAEVAVPK